MVYTIFEVTVKRDGLVSVISIEAKDRIEAKEIALYELGYDRVLAIELVSWRFD